VERETDAHAEWCNDHTHVAEDPIFAESRRFFPTAHRHKDGVLEMIPGHLLEEKDFEADKPPA